MKIIISSSKLISLLFSISVLCFAIVSLSYAAVGGWQAPTSPPPSINAPLPLTESGTAQGKIGMLILNCGNGTDCVNSSTFAASGLLVPYGNVGIGTMSPGSRLEVKNGNISVIRNDGTAAQSSIKNTNTSSGTQDAKSGIITLDSGGDPYTFWAIKNNTDSAYTTTWNAGIDNSDSDKFEILYGSMPTASPFFTITTAGNVGIGTTGPTSKFEINTGANRNIMFSHMSSAWNIISLNGDVSATGLAGIEGGATGDNNLYVNAGSGANVIIRTSGQYEKMRITDSGKVGIGTNSPSYQLDVRGGTVAGAGAYVNSSWSGYKKDFLNVDPQDTLDKISKLNIKSWVYKSDWVSDDPYRHISPFGEDFYKAFGLGRDEKVITSLDVAGVGLVGIQGLLQKVNNIENKNAALTQEVESLKAELSDLKTKLNIEQ